MPGVIYKHLRLMDVNSGEYVYSIPLLEGPSSEERFGLDISSLQEVTELTVQTLPSGTYVWELHP